MAALPLSNRGRREVSYKFDLLVGKIVESKKRRVCFSKRLDDERMHSIFELIACEYRLVIDPSRCHLRPAVGPYCRTIQYESQVHVRCNAFAKEGR